MNPPDWEQHQPRHEAGAAPVRTGPFATRAPPAHGSSLPSDGACLGAVGDPVGAARPPFARRSNSFDDGAQGSPFGFGSIGDSIGLSLSNAHVHSTSNAVAGPPESLSATSAIAVGRREHADEFGSLPLHTATAAGGPASVGDVFGGNGGSVDAMGSAPSVALAAWTPDWIVVGTPNSRRDAAGFPAQAEPGVSPATHSGAADTTGNETAVANAAVPQSASSAKAASPATPKRGSRREQASPVVISPELAAQGVDAVLADQLRSVEGAATCQLSQAIARCSSARLAAGAPTSGHTQFPEGANVVQVFVGQLPSSITAEALGAVIDNLLSLHAAPKLLHMRPPPPGSNQAAHALVTIEAKHQRALLALNRRCYFTRDAVFYVTSGRETSAFQRCVARAIAAAHGASASDGGSMEGGGDRKAARPSRACVVVEPANRSVAPAAGSADGRASAGGKDARRRTPHSGRATPNSGRRSAPPPTRAPPPSYGAVAPPVPAAAGPAAFQPQQQGAHAGMGNAPPPGYVLAYTSLSAAGVPGAPVLVPSVAMGQPPVPQAGTWATVSPTGFQHP